MVEGSGPPLLPSKQSGQHPYFRDFELKQNREHPDLDLLSVGVKNPQIIRLMHIDLYLCMGTGYCKSYTKGTL